ncbi:MAG: ATP-binding protein [Holophagae bacterium]|jgi:PAS domain S-box-containing protein
MALGLKGRFMAFVSAIIIALWVVLTLHAVNVQNRRLRSGLEERGKLLTAVTAANSTDALALLDVGELRRLLTETRDQDHVLDTVAFDEDGRILTDGTLKNPRRHTMVSESTQQHVAFQDGILIEYSGDTMTVTRAVKAGGRHLGGVRLRFSLAGLAADQTALARQTAISGAIFALLGMAAAALIAGAVTRPLKEVTKAARTLSEGGEVPHIPVRTSDEVGELAAAFNEMTNRLRQTTVSRDFLDGVLENMGECLMVTERDGTLTRINSVASALLGESEEQLIGRHCGELLRAPTGLASILHLVRDVQRVQGIEAEVIRADGSGVPVLVSVSAIEDSGGGKAGYVIVAADISDRLRIERQKDEFVTMVHHEVRTPLTAVRGAIGLLDGGVAGKLTDRAKELLSIALRNSERMERLVNDILVARRMDAGHLDFRFEETELLPLVAQAIEATAEYGQQHDVGFEMTVSVDDAVVRVDPDRFIQVLTNILSNAVRFSAPGEKVFIGVARHGTYLRIAVTDRGPGIADDFLERVFEPFARGRDDDWRHKSGTGLGMAIAKSIVEELGGRIDIETEVGSGTTFFVDLPECR